MNWKIPAGLMAFLVTILPLVGADSVSVTGDVPKAISVTFNYNSVGFGSVTQGSADNHPSPDYTTGEYNATIDTNYAYQLDGSGTDFDDGGGHTFGIGNLTFDSDETLISVNPTTALSTGSQTLGTSSTTGTGIDDFHGYELDVPSYQYSASYSSTVTLTYSNQ